MERLSKSKANLGTSPVFLTAISTILGAIMFLRFGYAVGIVEFLETIRIILFAHLVTIPTAMAIAEIATNQKVEGGGEFYIISRSFGINIGASQGEAFDPIYNWVNETCNLVIRSGRKFEFLRYFRLRKFLK